MEINQRIFKILQEKKLKQSDLADVLGVSTGQVTTWKKRETDPPAKYLVKICEFLDISINDLLDIYVENDINYIYSKLSPEDKAIVDNIFNRYRSNTNLSSISKIG